MVFDGDLAAAALHYGHALELDPANEVILLGAARLASSLGRLEEAIMLQEYAIARDPVNAVGYQNLSLPYLWAGRFDEALASAQTAVSLSPGRIRSQYLIGLALLLKGEPEAALVATQQEPSEVYRLIGLPMIYHALGQAPESDKALAKLIDEYEQVAAYNIAYVLAFRGDADRAFVWLNKAVEYQDSGLGEIPVENFFSSIHNDPRWLPFLESIGKSPEQLAAIKFKVSLPG